VCVLIELVLLTGKLSTDIAETGLPQNYGSSSKPFVHPHTIRLFLLITKHYFYTAKLFFFGEADLPQSDAVPPQWPAILVYLLPHHI
jgi:hypothetical protein